MPGKRSRHDGSAQDGSVEGGQEKKVIEERWSTTSGRREAD